MKTLIALGLFFHAALALCAPQKPTDCAYETEKLLAIPSRALKMDSHREELEAQIHETVEHAILRDKKTKAAELRLIPHWRFFRATYSARNSSGKAQVDAIADEQGTIQNYKVLENGKTQYWCRNSEKRSP